jgi:hypothetical protein
MSDHTLEILRDLYPLSVPRTVSIKHVAVFADYMLRANAAPPAPCADTDELAWIEARRGALRLAGVYIPVERGQA